jgi:hypothetical protein
MPDPEHDQERLDDLQRRIDETRREVNEGTELDDEPRFIDEGTVGEETVDDTIAPPG